MSRDSPLFRGFVGVIATLWLLLAQASAEDGKVDLIVVQKAQRTLQLMSQGSLLRSYAIRLGSQALGDKQQEGDGRTPEGRYVIAARNENSAFHLALKVSYPDATDRADALKRGVSPGGDIFIHGAPNWWVLPGQPPGDWTRGCIAVTKTEIEEIWKLVPDGTPIEIRP